ncbi:MAG: hypothetical protein ACLQVN_00615 [Bryobacteraceae bacterium]
MFRVLPGLVVVVCAGSLGAQNVIETVAGGNPPVTPISAVSASVGDPPRPALDRSGNLYFGGLHSVFKVDTSGTLTRIAGNGRSGYLGDGGPATAAQLEYPAGIAIDAAGNVYVADRDAAVVRRISSSGAISTYAGTGIPGYAGDGGPAALAQLNAPLGVALDAGGNLYVADTGNNAVRKISPNGTISTAAGNGVAGYSSDGVQASTTSLNGPEGVAVDSLGNLYIADTINDRVRLVSPGGIISTVAGTGSSAVYAPIWDNTGVSTTTGDGGPATAAAIVLPTDVALDSSGNLYIADYGNGRIRQVVKGTIETLAGAAGGLPLEIGQLAASEQLTGPTGLAVNAASIVYFAEGSIGTGSGLAPGDFRIWEVNSTGLLAVAAGNGLESYSGDGGPAAVAQLNTPAGVALDSSGNLFVADTLNHRVRKISPAGVITTVAGNGVAGFSGDGGAATSAQLDSPMGVAVDRDGTIYIADTHNNRIRIVVGGGVIYTLAGNGNASFYGDGGPGGAASVHAPQGVAVDNNGNVLVADTGNQRIRRITPDGAIHTVAGNGGQGYSGDGGAAARAQLNLPAGITVDAAGTIYAADTGNNRVRVISPSGNIFTIAGNGTSAVLSAPQGLAVDAAGDLFIADTGHNQVREIPSGGQLTTIAGSGACCYSGDGGTPTSAALNLPQGVAVDPSGDVFIADSDNSAVRVIEPSSSAPSIAAVVNGASGQSGPLAPGEVAVVYGAGLGPGTLAAAASRVTQLGDASLLFNGVAGEMLYASSHQLSAIVPAGLSGSTVTVTAVYGDVESSSAVLPLAQAAPALFTASDAGSGPAEALNQNGTLNNAANPAVAGSTITLFATGTAAGSTLSVTIQGVSAAVQSASVTTPGVTQISVQVPSGLTAGAASVVLQSAGVASPPGVTIAIH